MTLTKTIFCLKHEPAYDTPNYLSTSEPLSTFSDILLPKNKDREKVAKRIKNKCQKLKRNREIVKKNREKSPSGTKKAEYIQTDDSKAVNYDDDINIDDLAIVGYNSNTEMNLADKRTPPTNVAQQQAKRIIKKTKPKKKGGKINQKTKKEKMTTSYLLSKCLCILEKGWRGKQENKKTTTSYLLNRHPCTLEKS